MQRRFAPYVQRSVQASDQALGSGFFIAAATHDLASQEQSRGISRHIRPRVSAVPSMQSYSMAYPGRTMRACSNPGMVASASFCTSSGMLVEKPCTYFSVVYSPSGCDKQLMARLIGKADNLIFDAGAIPRPRSCDDAVKHRTAIQIGAQNLVSFFVGIGQIARRLLKAVKGFGRC